MRKLVVAAAAVASFGGIAPAASAQSMTDIDWQSIRSALTAFVADNVCVKVKGCAIIATAAVEGVNKIVEIAVDRHFEAEDQALADRTGITIRYADGTVIRPRGQ